MSIRQTQSHAARTSPCVQICTIAEGVCAGCKRSLKEIARWGAMSDAEREAVLRDLPKRPKPAVTAPPAPR